MLIGWGLSVAVFIAVRYIFSPIIDPQVKFWILLAGIPLGALAGGFYVGRQPAYAFIWLQSALVAILQMAVLLLFRMMPLDAILAVVTLAAALLGTLWAQRMPFSASGTVFTSRNSYDSYSPYGRTRYDGRSLQEEPPARIRLPVVRNPFARFFSGLRANRLYDQLLRRVRMDRETADRLVEYERRRTPSASREALVRNALDRLNRDRR